MQRSVIQESSLAIRLDVKFRLVDLKPVLRQHGVRVSGRKADLIQEFLRSVPTDVVTDLVTDMNLFDLTPKGSESVAAYEARVKEDRAQMEVEALRALRIKDLVRAGQIVSAHDARQAFRRGISHEWKKGLPNQLRNELICLLDSHFDDLDCQPVERIEVGAILALSVLVEEKPWETANRLVQALNGHFRCSSLEKFANENPHGLADRILGYRDRDESEPYTAADLAAVYAETKIAEANGNATLHELRGSISLRGVEILAGSDCPSCKLGPRYYTWAEVENGSPLPRHWGCTCSYVPWLD